MSISSNRTAISRIQRELADLRKKIADESKKEAQLLSSINQLQRSITSSTSPSTVSSKMSQISRYTSDISKCNAKNAELSKKIADKTAELHRYETQLTKDEESERKKLELAQKKREKEQQDLHKKLKEKMDSQIRTLHSRMFSSKTGIHDAINDEDESPQYDVFISHASEDKDLFVRPFAEYLKSQGVKVWYDEFSLAWGDSLRKKIDKGLANSRFGIVVISKNFIKKQWTEYELNGLIASEIEGTKRVLPIWHEISKSEVIKFSPSLADKVAMNTAIQTYEEIADQLVTLLR
ncbi:toll/interleukin-1 receptor domain-containing protein [Klebsiella pasteurii]|uniref:toll/interleukin-1 receptor domain-containing protein n=1 Tax=Klebsiella pasteurii TaxID=2587529 RepID=UPI001C7CACB9|nr:toll/interleukin-1 receptor domain-containing protein [Klebsiella pasteurii]